MKQQFLYNYNPQLFESGYTGFINISGQNIYKSSDKQNDLLLPANTFENFINTSDYYTDWVYGEEKTLPYQLNDILLQPNELVHAHVLNDTFRKLFTNIEYILSRCTFYTNTVPTEYYGWFGCAIYMDVPSDDNVDISYHIDNEYSFHDSSKPCYQYGPCQFASTSGITTDTDVISKRWGDLTGNNVSITAISATFDDPVSTYSSDYTWLDNAIKTLNFTTRDGKNLMLMVSKTELKFIQIDKEGSTYTFNQTIKQPISSNNNVMFKNIVDADIDENNNLYILDKDLLTIYQYDLKYIINDDKLFTTPVLVNIIGGGDNINSCLYKFGSVKFIKCSGEYVFIYDDIEHNILVFDKYLNFIRCIGNIGFSLHVPVSIVHRILQQEYYVLTEDANLFVFDTNFKLKTTYKLDDIATDCVSIATSYNDSNVYYLATVDNLYQKLFSNNKTVGKFEFEKLGIKNDLYKWWRSTYIPWGTCDDLWGGSYNLPAWTDKFIVKSISVNNNNTNNSDEIWMFANNGRIVWLNNELKQQTLLIDTYKLKFNKNDLKVSEDEYVQSFTYNKLIYKFLDILLNLNTSIAYQPTYQFNGNILYYNGLQYVTNKIDLEPLIKNCKIYNNDILTTDVINRVLKTLFIIEQSILDITKPYILNTRYQKTQTLTVEF